MFSTYFGGRHTFVIDHSTYSSHFFWSLRAKQFLVPCNYFLCCMCTVLTMYPSPSLFSEIKCSLVFVSSFRIMHRETENIGNILLELMTKTIIWKRNVSLPIYCILQFICRKGGCADVCVCVIVALL